MNSKNEYKMLIRMNLGFFAEKDEKTEMPTEKKRKDARKEGQIAKSPEVNTAFLFLAGFTGLRAFSGYISRNIQEIFHYNFALLSEIDDIFTQTFMVSHINAMFAKVVLIALPLLVITMFVGIASNIVQVGWLVTFKPIKPKFSNVNPLKGIKRVFSFKSVINLLKSLAKMTVLIVVIYMIISREIDHIPELALMPVIQSLMYLGNLVIDMGITIGVLFLFIAIVDVAYSRFSHTKQLKMTKQEIKDEYRQTEGDPQIKGRIRNKMMEMSMRRMMQDVPKADVVITNPTHYAVAILYDKEVSDAPRVVAKGVDFAARKIKEKAKEHNVHIVEDKQLARTLYATVDIGQAIPPELYQAVAEILAFVYKLRGMTG